MRLRRSYGPARYQTDKDDCIFPTNASVVERLNALNKSKRIMQEPMLNLLR